jgi:hypothetical protein
MLSANIGSIIMRYIKHSLEVFPGNTEPFIVTIAEE